MSEIKLVRKPARRPRRAGGSSPSVPRGVSLNHMNYKTSWTYTAVSSGTTGTMASWTAGSISHSSEYSILASLFTEVRLRRLTAIFGPTQSVNGTVLHGTLIVGTNMGENDNSSAGSTAYSDVQNLTHVVSMPTAAVREIKYRMALPRNLEFSLITNDAPSTPTPWAGSPGTVKWYGSGFTASTVYFTLRIEAVYELRGRQ